MVKLRSVPQPDVAVIFAYRPVPSSSFKTTIKDVAAELKLDWHTVKTLDQQYMEAQLKRAGTPGFCVSNIPSIAAPSGNRPGWFYV